MSYDGEGFGTDHPQAGAGALHGFSMFLISLPLDSRPRFLRSVLLWRCLVSQKPLYKCTVPPAAGQRVALPRARVPRATSARDFGAPKNLNWYTGGSLGLLRKPND